MPSSNVRPAVETASVNPTIEGQLFLEVLQSFGEARLAVTGTSMLSSIWPGDILQVQRQDVEQISPGEVILFARHGSLVAHRVVEKRYVRERTILVTRGDRLRKPDPPVSSKELLGRVTVVARGGRLLEPRETRWGRVAAGVLSRSEILTRMALRWSMLRRSISGFAGPQLFNARSHGQRSAKS